MKIRSIEAVVLKVAAGSPYLGEVEGDAATWSTGYRVRHPWRSLYSPRFETVLVKVTAVDGTVGWGEALAPVGPEVAATIVRVLLAPFVVGSDATDPAGTFDGLRQLMRERGHLVGHQADALAAVDIALWDLAGRLAGRPVAELLGGIRTDPVLTYTSGLPRPTLGGRLDLARRLQADGAEAVKLHLGLGIERDTAEVAALAAACPGLRIAVDAHWAYTVPEAIELSRRLADLGVWFLEAPVAPEDIAGHAAVRRDGALPVAGGEALRARHEFQQWIEADALDIVQPDVGRTGLTEAMVIADLSSRAGLSYAPHHSTGLAPTVAAGVHLSSATAALVFEYQPPSVEVGARLLLEPMPFGAAEVRVPEGPGLGIEIDEPAVRALEDESI